MPTLTLFMTRGLSLAEWQAKGMLAREVALYNGLTQRGWQVQIITYGGLDDVAIGRQALPGARILPNRFHLSPQNYMRWLPLLHGRHGLMSDVLKTNQTPGGDMAVRASRFWRKPLVARCGYSVAMFEASAYGEHSPEAQAARSLEARVFGAAARVALPTPAIVADVVRRLPAVQPRIHLIPNYVETERFRPLSSTKRYDLIFVGRLNAQKNLPALLDALKDQPYTAALIGQGEEGAGLKATYGTLNGRITWIDRVPNDELPALLNQARAFILPSLQEGLPKVLLEAMACGLPVIGTRVAGIQDLIVHGETGYLCGTDAASIGEAIHVVLNDATLQAHLGAHARRTMEARYSLAHILDLEEAVLRDAMQVQR